MEVMSNNEISVVVASVRPLGKLKQDKSQFAKLVLNTEIEEASHSTGNVISENPSLMTNGTAQLGSIVGATSEVNSPIFYSKQSPQLSNGLAISKQDCVNQIKRNASQKLSPNESEGGEAAINLRKRNSNFGDVMNENVDHTQRLYEKKINRKILQAEQLPTPLKSINKIPKNSSSKLESSREIKSELYEQKLYSTGKLSYIEAILKSINKIPQNSSSKLESGREIKSELYEQKLYSTGKLSYIETIDFMEQLNYEVSRNLDVELPIEVRQVHNMVEKTSILSSKELGEAVLTAYLQKSRAFSNECKQEREPHVLMPQLVTDIEKRRLTILRDKDEKFLAVRDYTSSPATLWSRITSFIKTSQSSISALIINGKSVR